MTTAPFPKVLFVLGAGSSKNVGYPLGTELKNELLGKLNSSSTVFRALIESGISESRIQAFAESFDGAEFDTIDEHVHQIGDLEARIVGKRALAYLIRSMENQFKLRHRDGNAKHWYKHLVNHLSEYPDQVSPDQFSFITFNYDRSLSHYLHDVLHKRQIQAARRQAFVAHPNIVHIHGNVGPLPWQLERGGDSNSYYQYGAVLSDKDLGSYKPDILLPDDEREYGLLLSRVAAQAKIVIFVGFGFHAPNMRQLPWGPSGEPIRRFFSINPTAPPKALTVEGQPIRHIKGTAEQVMEDLFTNLADGSLLSDEVPEARFQDYSHDSTDSQSPTDSDLDQ